MYICFLKKNIRDMSTLKQNPSIVFYFPVKPHVYKYLQRKVGEKLIVSNHNFFGGIVLDILSKRYSDLKNVNNELSFPVEVSISYMEKMGFYIDAKIMRKFNYRIDDIFREEMRSFVQMNFRINRIPKESSLKSFMFEYNITEDDIKFETLIKDIQRNPQ